MASVVTVIKKYWTACCFSLLFSFTNVITNYFLDSGDHIQYDKTIALFLNIMTVAIITFVFYIIIKKYALSKFVSSLEVHTSGEELKYWGIVCLIHMICYMPVFLAYYPGLFAYDIHYQLPQAMGSFNTHHPLAHTLLMKFFYDYVGNTLFHSPNIGIAFATIFQMIIFSMAISYIHLYFFRKYVNRFFRIIMIIISSGLPVFSMLVIATTKDVLFAAFVGVLFVCIAYWENEPERFRKHSLRIIYIISMVIVVLFRNNGIYIVVGAAIVGCLLKQFRRNRTFLRCTVIGVILAVGLSKGLVAGLDAEKGSSNEMLSIPYQQIASVYNAKENELSSEEKEEIKKLLPAVENYRSSVSDPIKSSGTGMQNKKEFCELYVRLLIKYPKQYIKAFVLNNAGYLYIWDETNAEIYGADSQTRQGFLLSDTKTGFGINHISYFPKLEAVYEYLFSTNHYQQIYILKVLCSLSLYFWLIILSVFYIIDFKRQNMILSVIFLMLLLLTVFAGPCALVRYALPYIICSPVLFFNIFIVKVRTNSE